MKTHDHVARKQKNSSKILKQQEEELVSKNNVALSNFGSIQRVIQNPSTETITPDAVMQLQRLHGNQFVANLLQMQTSDTIQRAQWTYMGYQYFGTLLNTNNIPPPQTGPYNCWAAALSMVFGVSRHHINLIVGWPQNTWPQDTQGTRNLLAQMQAYFGINYVERFWYPQGMTTAEIEYYTPMAVGLPNHWVVVLGIGFDPLNPVMRRVSFWDPADGAIHNEDWPIFIARQPSLSYSRV